MSAMENEPPDPWEFAAEILSPKDNAWKPQPHQIPPVGNWMFWMLMGGRGAGKTAASARYMFDHLNGPPCLPGVPGGHWPGIIAPTLGDGVTSCVLGPSGLRLWDPGLKVRATPGGTLCKMSSGAEIKIFGAHTPEDVERLRSGGNRCIIWAEELAAWRYLEEAWQHMRYGLRVGPWPHAIISTTPKPRKVVKDLVLKSKDPNDDTVVITTATTEDNPHLPQHVKDMLFEDYGGTRLGRQELYAELLEDIEGALWTPTILEQFRIQPRYQPRRYDRVGIGVDPGVTDGGDETGIIVAGTVNHYTPPGESYPLPHRHGFVIADESTGGSPHLWARAVRDAFHDYEADIIVAEQNNGGELVRQNILSLDDSLPVTLVHASRGKAKRAEPIANMTEQGRIHMVGTHGKLEDQMTTWDPIDPDPSWSPDRMDAFVWIMSKLLQPATEVQMTTAVDTRLRKRR